jgi:hypothetical protein
VPRFESSAPYAEAAARVATIRIAYRILVVVIFRFLRNVFVV